MNPRMLFSALVLLAALGGAMSWRAFSLRAATQKHLVAVERNTREIATELRAAQERLAAAETKREQFRVKLRDIGAAEIAAAPALPKSAGTSARSGALTLNEEIKRWQEEQRRPEAQLKDLAERRARLPNTFGLFYRQLRLTAEEVRAFEDIAMRREEQVGDLMAVAQAQGLSLGDRAVSKLWETIHGDIERQQRELLGEAGFQELKTYERTAGIRDVVRHLAALTTVFGETFTPQQIERLVPLIANTTEGFRKGQYASAIAVDWNAALAAAATVLSPRQIELISTFEPDGGGMFHARWNGELVKATRPESLSLPKG
jgi:hypothetical protein